MAIKFAVSEPIDDSWETERQTLLELLEHTQNLLKAAQDSAARDRMDQSEQYRLLELRLTNQLRLVKEENTSLKEEMERISKTQGLDGMSLKGYMLKEIEKIEQRASEREAELLGQVESSRNEVQIYKGHLETRAKTLADDRAQLQKELEMARQETKRIHTYYTTQIQDLKTELSATANNLKKATDDIKSARNELASKESVEAGKRAQLQATWETEKEALQSTIRKLQKTLLEKEKAIAEMTTSNETDIKAELTPLKAQNETLTFDKLALKQQLQMASSLYVKKEKNLQQQLEKYKRLSEMLKERRGSTGSEATPDPGRIYALLMTMEEYDKQIRDNLGKVGKYTDLLTQKIESREGNSGNEDYEQKNRHLDELIAKFDQLQGLPDFQSLSGQVNDQVQAYAAALHDLQTKMTDILGSISTTFNEQMKEFQQQNEELIALRNENQRLQTELDTLSAAPKIDQVEELQKAQQELEHAKATILSYLESISALEEVVSKSKSGDEVNPELERLKIEVTRLTQENTNLSTSKRVAEETYEANTVKLRESLEAKTKESATLKTKFAQEKTRANERILGFSGKIEDAKKAVEEICEKTKNEFASLLQTLPETVKLEKAWTELQTETINSLKAQVSEREALLEETRAKWKEEVAQTQDDESTWSKFLTDAEKQAEALAGLNKTLGNMLHTLTQLAEALNNQVDQRTPGGGDSSRLREELENLRAEVATKEQEHADEIALIKTQAEAEIRSVKNIEAALTAEIAALRAKVKRH